MVYKNILDNVKAYAVSSSVAQGLAYINRLFKSGTISAEEAQELDRLLSKFNRYPQPIMEQDMYGPKRTRDGHLKSEPTQGLVQVTNAKPGICRCPTRVIGRGRPYNFVPDLVRQSTLSYVTRFQNLSSASEAGSSDTAVGLQYPLSYVTDVGAGETALPFYIFNVGLLPQTQEEVVVAGVKSVALVRPKVCYRLHYRNAYNYDATGTPVTQYFFRAYDSNILRNAPDTSTFADKNDFKIEWTSGSTSNYAKAKHSICNWVEFQALLRQGGSPSVDNTNVHTGFIQFPACMEPVHAAYSSTYGADYNNVNSTPTYDEAVSMDAFWTRFFNKRTAHPLMRSGGNFSKIAPRMFFEDTHCLKNELTTDASHPATTQMCTRWNMNRKFSTAEMSDALAVSPNEVGNGFQVPNYAQIESGEAFGTFPNWGQSLYAFVYCTQFGPPAVIPPAEGSNPSFDIMIRQFVQTATRLA